MDAEATTKSDRGGRTNLILLAAAWAAVGLPLAWGVYKTLENALKLFTS